MSVRFCLPEYFSNHVLNTYDRVGGIDGVLEGLRETIAESDIFMANLENFFVQRPGNTGGG